MTRGNRGYKLVKKENAQFAGIAYLMPDPDAPEKVLLAAALLESCWHQGYLTELIPVLEKAAKEQCAAKSAYLPVENPCARRAFEKAGYALTSVLSLPGADFRAYTKEL